MDFTINNFKPLQLGEFLARIGPLKDLYRDVELKDELKAQEKVNIFYSFIQHFTFKVNLNIF